MDLLLQLLTLLLREEERASRRQHLRYIRDSTNVFDIEENIFKEFFQLPKALAVRLINELEQHNTEPSDIPFALQVLSTLHFLGHGSYQRSIASNYLLPISQPSISRNINYICQLMMSKMSTRVKFCVDQEEKNAIKEGFYTKFGIKSVIGAFDCTHIGIVAPSINNPIRPARLYMNRKGYCSINVEAIVDSNLKFLSANAKYPAASTIQQFGKQHRIQQFGKQQYQCHID